MFRLDLVGKVILDEFGFARKDAGMSASVAAAIVVFLSAALFLSHCIKC